MRSLRSSAVALLLPLLGACTSTSWQVAPQPHPDDPIAPGHARVVVVRDYAMVGSRREVRIFDDERQIGVLGTEGWLCWDRVARRGVGRAEFEGYKLEYGTVENVFDMPREAGTTTWAVLRLKKGERQPTAEVVSPEEGHKLIEGRKPAEVR